MKTLRKKHAAFGLVEWLVVVFIIAVLMVMMVPRISSDYADKPSTQMLANARSLQIATSAMMSDTLSAPNANPGWTGKTAKGKPRPASLAEYFATLTNGDAYLSDAELRELLTVHGEHPPTGPLTAENIPFRIFWADEDAPADQPVLVSKNWRNGKLTDVAPFGRKKFIYFTKGGGGGVNRSKDGAAEIPKTENGRSFEEVELK